jgi:uncharacterized protein VirK/YbjX
MSALFLPTYVRFGQPYLARSFSEFTKQRCFVFHGSFLLSAIREAGADTFLRRGVRLFDRALDDGGVSIELAATGEHRYEGELSLVFYAGVRPIYVLGFSFAPGAVVGLDDAETIVIARMQGQPGALAEIREATKTLGDVSPQAALFAALEGVARAFGIARVVGVAGANNCSFDPERRPEAWVNAYDAFFLAQGAEGSHDGFYILSTPFPRKPASAAKPGHRTRTRRKQELKAEIAASSLAALRATLNERFVVERSLRKELSADGPEDAAVIPVAREALVEEFARLNAEIGALKGRVEDLERGQDHVLAAPPDWLRHLLASRVGLFRRLAERLDVLRLKLLGFDATFYLTSNRDVGVPVSRAVFHFVRRGRREQRAARFGARSSVGLDGVRRHRDRA